MTRQEIRRFSRAYRWAVAKGYFDVFNDEHFNAMRNRHHGADVLAVAPPAVFPGETPEWGFRLLSRSCYCRGRRSCGTSSCSAGRDRNCPSRRRHRRGIVGGIGGQLVAISSVVR